MAVEVDTKVQRLTRMYGSIVVSSITLSELSQKLQSENCKLCLKTDSIV